MTVSDRAPGSIRVISAPKQDYLLYLGRTATSLSFVVVLYAAFVTTYNEMRSFRPDSFNGTFQLLAAVKRLASDTSLGIDYVVFHGPLWALPALPAYLIADDAVAAAHAAKLWIGLTALPLAVGFFVFFALPLTRYRLFLVSAGMLATIQGSLLNLQGLGAMSMLGFRLAVGLGVVFLLTASLCARTWLRAVALAAISGVLLLMAADFALYAFIGCAAAFTGLALPKRFGYLWATLSPGSRFQRILRILVIAGGATIAFLVGLLILARGSLPGLFSVLRFQFLDVPGDQKWFFGAPPAETITSWLDLFAQPAFVSLWVINLAVAAAMLFFARHFPPHIAFVSLALGIYGLLSSSSYILSYASQHYLYQLRLSLLIVLLLALGSFSRVTSWQSPYFMEKRWRSASLSLIAGSLTLLLVPPLLSKSAEENSNFSYYKSQILAVGSFCRADSQESPVWSLYPGVPQVTNGVCFSPEGDLAIHAVGSRRNRYINAFKESDPLFVEIPRASRLPFVPWLRDTLFPVYWRIWNEYEPAAQTDETYIWRKKAGSGLTYVGSQTLKPVGDVWAVNQVPEDVLGVVTVDYRISNPLSSIPWLGATSRSQLAVQEDSFGVGANGDAAPHYVPLDPQRSRIQFPIWVTTTQTDVQFRVETLGLNHLQEVEIESAVIEWFELPDTPAWKNYLEEVAVSSAS